MHLWNSKQPRKLTTERTFHDLRAGGQILRNAKRSAIRWMRKNTSQNSFLLSVGKRYVKVTLLRGVPVGFSVSVGSRNQALNLCSFDILSLWLTDCCQPAETKQEEESWCKLWCHNRLCNKIRWWFCERMDFLFQKKKVNTIVSIPN